MFTGIVEAQAELISVADSGTNKVFTFRTLLDEKVVLDQSISHNGACLSVSAIHRNEVHSEIQYEVTAVEETLIKTNLGLLRPGDEVNLERSLKVGQRLDGHFVQGHVDGTGTVEAIEPRDGSWNFRIQFDPQFSTLLVDKGSVCVNGVSLTVVQSGKGWFTLTIIPFTWDHTNFKTLKQGDTVNLEFDILGKYFLKTQSFQS
jgi:riboflavin synthase